jgi:hypothetical protein
LAAALLVPSARAAVTIAAKLNVQAKVNSFIGVGIFHIPDPKSRLKYLLPPLGGERTT